MPDTLFIINPIASRGTTLSKWQSLKPRFINAGITFEEYLTSDSGEASRITRQALANGFSKIIAVGGDGTLNEIINGYLHDSGSPINPQASIGLLPCGTGSDFRRSVGLLNSRDAVNIILRSNTRLIDAMRVAYQDRQGKTVSRFAINIVSFGLGGEVVSLVNGWRNKLPAWVGGKLRFIAGAIGVLGQYRLKPVKVIFENGEQMPIDSNLIIVANGRFAGSGMMFAPQAKLDDGLLDVILTNCASRWDVVKELPRIFHGGYLKNPRVSDYQTAAVTIRCNEKLAIDIDGEAAGFAPAQISVLPSIIKFIC
ncbi:MAG: diacylglycerol kinase family protein [Acidobacteriota bacterium]